MCSLCSAVLALTAPVVQLPKITFYNDLFMALHIMYERIAPEDPIKDPTIVSIGLANINPSAQRAHPE